MEKNMMIKYTTIKYMYWYLVKKILDMFNQSRRTEKYVD